MQQLRCISCLGVTCRTWDTTVLVLSLWEEDDHLGLRHSSAHKELDSQVESGLAGKPHPHRGLWSIWTCSEALLDPTAWQEAGPIAVEGTQHLSTPGSRS